MTSGKHWTQRGCWWEPLTGAFSNVFVDLGTVGINLFMCVDENGRYTLQDTSSFFYKA